jgi:hypothetical protein
VIRKEYAVVYRNDNNGLTIGRFEDRSYILELACGGIRLGREELRYLADVLLKDSAGSSYAR